MTRRRFAFLSLLLAALIVLAGCGNSSGAAVGADANNIRIAALEGTVHVTDDSRAELEARERMNLFSGYGVGTDTRSYTWIDLDAEKMLKMDEESGIGIEQEGRHLHITLQEGALFFCADELGEDETLEFETVRSVNLSMAIRGTTGYIDIVSEEEMVVGLCEGTVEVTAADQTFTVETGSKAAVRIGEDGQVTIEQTPLDYKRDVPIFALEELLAGDAHDRLGGAGVDTADLDEMEGYRSTGSLEALLDRMEGAWNNEGISDRIISVMKPPEKCIRNTVPSFMRENPLTRRSLVLRSFCYIAVFRPMKTAS